MPISTSLYYNRSMSGIAQTIASELNRSDWTYQLCGEAWNQIQAEYASEAFYFNQMSFTFSTVASQETYGEEALDPAGTNVTLAASDAKTRRCYGSGNTTYTLPGGPTMTQYQAFTIINESSGVVSVVVHGTGSPVSGGLINASIEPGGAEGFQITNTGSSAGTWTDYHERTSGSSQIVNLHSISSLILTDGNWRNRLERTTDQELDECSTAPSWIGRPVKYAYWNKRIRFLPIPDAVYTITVKGTKDYQSFGASVIQTNDWLLDDLGFAFALHSLTAYAYKNFIYAPEKAAIRQQQADRLIEKIRAETSRRLSSGTVRATDF